MNAIARHIQAQPNLELKTQPRFCPVGLRSSRQLCISFLLQSLCPNFIKLYFLPFPILRVSLECLSMPKLLQASLNLGGKVTILT
jgi:hypothetical protein